MMGPDEFQNINNGERQRVGVYGEWKKQVAPQWTTQLGARYENVRTSTDKVRGYDDVDVVMMDMGMGMMMSMPVFS